MQRGYLLFNHWGKLTGHVRWLPEWEIFCNHRSYLDIDVHKLRLGIIREHNRRHELLRLSRGSVCWSSSGDVCCLQRRVLPSELCLGKLHNVPGWYV